MKKTIFIISLIMFICTLRAEQEFQINIYLENGDIKSYKVLEIDKILVETEKSGYLIKLFKSDGEIFDFTGVDIDSISFSKDESENLTIVFYMQNDNSSYLLSEIDSLNIIYSEEPPPVISGISHESARVGDEIIITGSGFGATSDNGYVTFKGKNASEYIEWSDTQIKLNVPRGALNGKLFVRVNNIKSNEFDFKIIPVLNSMNKTTIVMEETLTLKGVGFGNVKNNGSVFFNGLQTTNISFWNDSTVLVKVPKAASSGEIYILYDGIESNRLAYMVTPKILNITPAAVRVNDTLTINGGGFGPSQDTSVVYFNSLKAVDFADWNDTAITVVMPQKVKNGKLAVKVNGKTSNQYNFWLIPVINILRPDTTGIGEEVYISGTSFGAKQDSNFVKFNDKKATEYKQWNDTSAIFTVPANASSGKLTITVAGQESDAVDIAIIQHITSIEPPSFKGGDEIKIKGTKFGPERGTSLIYFNEIQATDYRSWTDNEISVIVPENAVTGLLHLTIAGIKSNQKAYSIIPEITNISPTSGRLNSMIGITGKGFGSERGNSEVTIGNAKVSAYQQWSNTEISVQVPEQAMTGKVYVTVNGNNSNQEDYTVLPTIISITPTGGAVGDLVTIRGASFGESRGTNTVNFSGAAVSQYETWGDREIRVRVPNGAQSGVVYVQVNGTKSNEMNFSIRPNISGINPTTASVGDNVTISGSGFGATRGTNIVTFANNKNATDYQSWSNTQIVVKVPTGARTGKVSVTVNTVKSNEVDFTVSGSSNYDEVTIGTQTWMAKNLDVTTYRNGDEIPQVTDATEWANLTTGAWCYYNNDESNGNTYGKLYNWYAVNDSRGLAPEGWHVPTDDEWKTLEMYLGMSQAQADEIYYRGTDEGSKLAGRADLWNDGNLETNANFGTSGFSALPGGGRSYYGIFANVGVRGYWWSSEETTTNAWNRQLVYSNSEAYRTSSGKAIGYSVRCIKD